MWDRPFLRRLFGFDHLIEVYKREHERVYGYYVLPLLVGDRLVGRADLKSRPRARRAPDQALHAGARRAPAARRAARAAADAAGALARARVGRALAAVAPQPMSRDTSFETRRRRRRARTGTSADRRRTSRLLLHERDRDCPTTWRAAPPSSAAVHHDPLHPARPAPSTVGGPYPSRRTWPTRSPSWTARAGQGLGGRALVGRPPRAPSRRRAPRAPLRRRRASTRSERRTTSSPSSRRRSGAPHRRAAPDTTRSPSTEGRRGDRRGAPRADAIVWPATSSTGERPAAARRAPRAPTAPRHRRSINEHFEAGR